MGPGERTRGGREGPPLAPYTLSHAYIETHPLSFTLSCTRRQRLGESKRSASALYYSTPSRPRSIIRPPRVHAPVELHAVLHQAPEVEAKATLREGGGGGHLLRVPKGTWRDGECIEGTPVRPTREGMRARAPLTAMSMPKPLTVMLMPVPCLRPQSSSAASRPL